MQNKDHFFPTLGLLKIWAGSFFEVEVIGGSDSKESACNAGDQGSILESLSPEDPLEKGMVTHSSILAWRIPRTEEPGGLQSMGSQRVGHD